MKGRDRMMLITDDMRKLAKAIGLERDEDIMKMGSSTLVVVKNLRKAYMKMKLVAHQAALKKTSQER